MMRIRIISGLMRIKEARLVITDNGSGIAPELLESDGKGRSIFFDQPKKIIPTRLRLLYRYENTPSAATAILPKQRIGWGKIYYKNSILKLPEL
jgi:hypothetical protein